MYILSFCKIVWYTYYIESDVKYKIEFLKNYVQFLYVKYYNLYYYLIVFSYKDRRCIFKKQKKSDSKSKSDEVVILSKEKGERSRKTKTKIRWKGVICILNTK